MSDPDSSPLYSAVNRATNYLIDPTPATHSLRAILRQRIEKNGPLCFSEFMEIALYEPSLGYYARETRQVGRSGDFFTSVSVGPLFGEILAHRFLREWENLGSPGRWRIIEYGAHDGTLARDILNTICRFNSSAFNALEYLIPEPLERLQAAQRDTLVEFVEKTRFASSVSEYFTDPLPGIAFGNELLDALPFHVIKRRDDTWYECKVSIHPNGEFTWDNNPSIVDPHLMKAVEFLGNDFPNNYRTEIRTNFYHFLEPLTRCISRGLFLWADYGFARPEYYHPGRISGTLQTYSKHKAAQDPLMSPGEIDITAHVDFTAAALAAIALGCVPAAFISQGAWLTNHAREWLLSQEGNPDHSALRQFQTLTHPAHLGSNFHIIELIWNQPNVELSVTDAHRLALNYDHSGPAFSTQPRFTKRSITTDLSD